MRQGRIDVAIAEYSALVTDVPGDLSSANALGDLLVRAGRSPEALPYYLHVADSYLREGFFSKAAGFYKKVLKFSPNDEVPALRLAEAVAAQGLLVEAKALLTTIANARRKRGDAAGADELVLRVAQLDPKDVPARLEGARVLRRNGDPRAIPLLRDILEYLRAQDRRAEALAVLREVVDAEPGDTGLRAELARSLIDAGDVGGAAGVLDPALIRGDRVLLRLAAELALRRGSIDAAREALERWLEADPSAAAEVAAFGGTLVDLPDDRSYLGVDMAVGVAASRQEFQPAVAWLEAFLADHPLHVPALLRLIDVAIDGDLEPALAAAQVRLIGAYANDGQLREARLVAEDLLLRDPEDEQHRARLRDVLVRQGDPSPDATIDGLLQFEEDDGDEPDGQWTTGVEAGRGDAAAEPMGEAELLAALNVIAREEGAPPTEATPEASALTPEEAGPAMQAVFDDLRARATPQRDVDGQEQLALGRTYLAAGLVDPAVAAFERAARDAPVRAAACVALGELFEDQDDLHHAIEWYERAADAMQSTEHERLDAMRRLALVLESANESVRALAIWLEIQTLHPDDLEAAERVTRLSSSGTGR